MAEITSKLLKQAIADAEAVRETAVANAKLILEESMAPQIKNMIARRLRVESDTATEKPHQDGEPVGGDSPSDASDIGSSDNKEPSADAGDSSDIGTADAPDASETGWYDDWDESDFDLDSIIKELEGDIAAISGEKDHVNPAKDPSVAPATDVTDFGGTDDVASDAPAEAPVAKTELPFDKPEEEESPDKKDDDLDEEVNLDEILAELDADDPHGLDNDSDEFDVDGDVGDATNNVGKSDRAAVVAKLVGLKKELQEYRDAVRQLRERLVEVNLLNAKLLFTNKMFHRDRLTTEQKMKILESFDRARTVREVKLVYTSLVENLSTAAKTFTASRKKVVTEGLASKVIPSTAPKVQEVIVENAVAKRLQELAGII